MDLSEAMQEADETRLPLKLGVSRHRPDSEDEGMKEHVHRFLDSSVREKIFSARGVFCHFCFFKPKSDKVLYFHCLDGDYLNLRLRNLYPACGFCMACFHLRTSAKDGGARLVVWPEITQAQINRALRALYVGRELGYKDAEALGKRVFRGLTFRAKLAYSGWGSSDPEVFAKAFLAIDPDSLEEYRGKTRDLRLVPTPNNFFLPEEHMKLLCDEARQVNPEEKNKTELMYSLVLKDEESNG